MQFRDHIAARWPHFSDGKEARFYSGATPLELRRVALETQLDCKILVRAHLAGLTSALPEVVYTGNILDFDFEALPHRCVIKPRCQTRVIKILDGNFDLKTRKQVSHAELRDFFSSQWCYRGLNNDVIIEKWVTHADGTLCTSQLNIFVFHGRAEYINYGAMRWEDVLTKRYDFDREWNRVVLYTDSQPRSETVSKPHHFADVVTLSEKLGAYYHDWTGIPQVRVDLFDTDQGPVFGEFAGGANGGEGLTDEAQDLLGSLW
jgi:hypothetical protein